MMSGPNLFLWVMLEPLSLLFGGLAALVVYRIAHPRPDTACGELLIEGWRIYAILAAVPAFVLGAEMSLWLLLLDYRAPIAYTHLIDGIGLVIAALAATPLIAAWCREDELRGRPAIVAAAALLVGVTLIAFGMIHRTRSWEALAASAPHESAALHEMATLKSYRYLSDHQAEVALEESLPQVEDTLALVAAARDDGYPTLDGIYMKPYLADRIAVALREAAPDQAMELRLEAVPAYWWLTGNSKATLQSYALSVQELRPAAMVGQRSYLAALAHGLTHEEEPLLGILLRALDEMPARDNLDGAVIAGLAAHLDDPPPSSDLAIAILLREASTASLRPILPRFVDEASPAWTVLRSNCPKRTHGLVALTDSEDPAVAAGAREVLGYVRQYCARWRLPGG